MENISVKKNKRKKDENSKVLEEKVLEEISEVIKY